MDLTCIEFPAYLTFKVEGTGYLYEQSLLLGEMAKKIINSDSITNEYDVSSEGDGFLGKP